MIDFALKRASGDLHFGKNDSGFATFFPIRDADRIAQKIRITLRFWLGEWFLDNTRGVPYLEDILVKGARPTTIETLFRNAIMSVDGVSGITAFSMQLDNRTRVFRLEFTCETPQGRMSDAFELSGNG